MERKRVIIWSGLILAGAATCFAAGYAAGQSASQSASSKGGEPKKMKDIENLDAESVEKFEIPETPSRERKRPCTVAELYIYPVKSMKGIRVSRAKVEKEGFQWDRRWMVIDEGGSFLSQRRVERMALIHVSIVERDAYGRPAVELSADHMKCSIQIPVDTSPQALRESPVRVWDDMIEGVHDQGNAAARWLEEALCLPGVRLVYMGKDCKRPVSQKYAVTPDDCTGFSDGYPFLVASKASLNDLNRRILANGRVKKPLTMDRFRPNIVLSGVGPYQEDVIRSITFSASQVVLHIVKPCSRCKITTIDQDAGKAPSISFIKAEPLITLQSYRRREEDVFFGQNAIWVRPSSSNDPEEGGDQFIQVGEPFTFKEGSRPNVTFDS